MTDLFSFNYRRTDPETSKEAGRAAERFRSGDHKAILDALDRAQCPLAAEQISEFIGWNDSVRVCRRLKEIECAGLIQRTSERHINKSGRGAFKYRRANVRRETSEAA